MDGIVFDIQRFSLDDGPGIRTTVFLKGCPLRCAWCHNPESFTLNPSLSYSSNKCVLCGRCASVCHVHCFEDGVHTVRHSECNACGRCASECAKDALRIIGKHCTPESVIAEVMKDNAYYGNDGGVTFSGGEPTMQKKFLHNLLLLAKKEGLHTCLETSGYVDWAYLSDIAGYVDLFLYDYKLSDEEDHIRYTGVSNCLILDNLRRLNEIGGNIILRCPIIKGINDHLSHFEAIGALKQSYKGIKKVQLMPYHRLGTAKWEEAGLSYSLHEVPTAEKDEIDRWEELI